MSGAPALAIVLAATPAGDLSGALAALSRSLADESLELLHVGDLPRSPALPPAWRARRLATSNDALVPEQWGAGARAATAPSVALLSSELRVLPAWWHHLSRELDAGNAAAAGAVALAPAAGAVTSATYLARFSAFLPRAAAPRGDAPLPGEGTVYRREALLAAPAAPDGGLWEVAVNADLRAGGARLSYLSEPFVELAGPTRLLTTLRARHEHAARFAAGLVHAGRATRAGLMARAPLVPAVLVARVVRRALTCAEGRRALRRGGVILPLFAAAWAAGEVRGAWRGTWRAERGSVAP